MRASTRCPWPTAPHPGGRTSMTGGRASTVSLPRSPTEQTRTVILGNIPALAEPGPQCLAAHRANVQTCSAPVASAVEFSTGVEEAKAKELGIGFIDPVPWFCSSVCTAVIGRYNVYLDGVHISCHLRHVSRGRPRPGPPSRREIKAGPRIPGPETDEGEAPTDDARNGGQESWCAPSFVESEYPIRRLLSRSEHTMPSRGDAPGFRRRALELINSGRKGSDADALPQQK